MFIECKAFAADRTAGQIARADDIILIQGYEAVALIKRLTELLRARRG